MREKHVTVAVRDNDLLALLDPESRLRLAAIATPMTLPAGAILCEADDLVDAIYWPLETSLVALLIITEDGGSAEAALIGRDGMVGYRAGDAAAPAFARAIVVQGGGFLRIPLADYTEAQLQSPAIASLAARYADCLMAQILQSVACSALHSLEQRTAGWLLTAADRTGNRYINVTQEQLGALLGAGRSYTSRQIQRFKAQRLVRTRRGGITVVDYDGIVKRACACHMRVQHYAAIMLNDWSVPAAVDTLDLQSMG